MSGSGRGASDLTGRRILLVEDEALIAVELEELLSSCGAEVLGPFPTVRAALDALGALAESPPDAAVLDVNLRGERSAPVARALRRAGTPFVVTTGYLRDQIEEPELKDAPLLAKPVDRHALLGLLHRALRAA